MTVNLLSVAGERCGGGGRCSRCFSRYSRCILSPLRPCSSI